MDCGIATKMTMKPFAFWSAVLDIGGHHNSFKIVLILILYQFNSYISDFFLRTLKPSVLACRDGHYDQNVEDLQCQEIGQYFFNLMCLYFVPEPI